MTRITKLNAKSKDTLSAYDLLSIGDVARKLKEPKINISFYTAKGWLPCLRTVSGRYKFYLRKDVAEFQKWHSQRKREQRQQEAAR